jgi:outer membrane biosynthesis protein TonB
MGFTDVLNVDLGGGMRIFLRYIPATQKLTKKKMTEPEQALKQAMLGSALMHGVMALLLMISVPEVKNIPKLDNVPERFAKLLVEPPKPIIPVPEPKIEPPKPEPKKIVKPEPKRPEPKKIVKQEPKKLKLPKKLVEQNKFPIVVKNPPKVAEAQVVRKPEPKPVKVESLGALAALGAISDSPMKDMPQVSNIQINKDAGGASSKVANTTGVLNAIPSSGGKLLAAGGGPVKTGGKGIGSGTAYGVQGLSGASGSRGIAAAVVGSPQLATASGKVEGLTRAQVMDVVKKYLGEVQQCYERNLLSNPSLAGRMEFEWDIQPAGKVSAVRVRRSTVANGDGLGECVKGVFAKMKFPKAKNGQSTTPNIGFPFGRL